jgi:type IV pilus biogenesis protein PilP
MFARTTKGSLAVLAMMVATATWSQTTGSTAVAQSASAASRPADALPTTRGAGTSAWTIAGAPTLGTLAEIQQAELEDAARKRFGKLKPPAPAASAASVQEMKVALKSSAPREAPPAPAPDPTKRVAAIYGPTGKEVADVVMPDGQVVSVREGAAVDGLRVVRVTASHVELEGWLSPPAKKVAKTTGSGKTKRADRNGGQAEAAKQSPVRRALRVAAGETFK